MEVGSIVQFLENRTILVTGATGFLAKIMVEKVLRVQPNVKKLYLLLRAADDKAAAQRFQSEVISKDLFRLVKEKWGANLSTLISEKIHLVPGDISSEDFLLKDPNLMEQLCSEVDLIANIAANTNFDERYDVALGINTLGAKHVLNFAKKCPKLKALVHVSTAYVCGEKGGLILESPYKVGETLNGTTGLCVEDELRLAGEKLTDLRADGADERTIALAMKDLGIQRARKYGWPNTYVFTKAMGEMMIGQLKQNLPVIVVRPTIITSTLREPFPGWVEGIRTIDSLAIGYGKGKLTCFLGDPKTVIDAIPADMVVNAMLVSMAVHSKGNFDGIYHVGSSVSNPVRFSDIKDFGYRYFTAKPWINKDGRPVKIGKITIMNSMDSFHRYMTLRYFLFLKGLEVANTAFCHFFEGTYLNLDRKIKYVLKLVELYRPYLFFKGVFDDMNTERLRVAARDGGAEEDMFYFDPKVIKWDEYFIGTHLPGAVRHVFK